jgi:acyl dehydratase
MPDEKPGMTLDEVRAELAPRLPEDLFPGGSRAGWWLKTVQLDLETKGLVVDPGRFRYASTGVEGPRGCPTGAIHKEATAVNIDDRHDASAQSAAPRPLRIGDTASRSLTLTADHVATFAELTGDYNPLHFDEDFAAGTRFGRLVVQGGLTTGLLHALVAMDLPGPGTVFLSQDWKFTAPVYIGDTITAHAEVLSIHESKPVSQLAIRVERQGGETVLEGEAWCYRFVPATNRED